MSQALINRVARKLAVLALTLVLAACSGGGGGGGGVTVSIDDVQITEGDAGQANLTFTITLSQAAGDTVTVEYATNAGTATPGTDFVTTNGTATFIAGDTQETMQVAIIGETDPENDETFTVVLTNATGDASIADGTGVGTIVDNDTPPPPVDITIDDVNTTEGDAGQVNLTFTISLSAADGNTVTVGYQTIAGSATADVDYVSTNGTATFLAGDTSEPVSVPINGDTDPESNETFTVVLSNETGNANITTIRALVRSSMMTRRRRLSIFRSTMSLQRRATPARPTSNSPLVCRPLPATPSRWTTRLCRHSDGRCRLCHEQWHGNL